MSNNARKAGRFLLLMLCLILMAHPTLLWEIQLQVITTRRLEPSSVEGGGGGRLLDPIYTSSGGNCNNLLIKFLFPILARNVALNLAARRWPGNVNIDYYAY